MATDTPVFGPHPDLDEYNHIMANFGIEMFRFTDVSRVRARRVNILHFGTDLAAAEPEMDKIVRFMALEGYLDVEHERGMHPWGDTDMLVVGSDEARFTSVHYVLWCVSIGLFGLVPYWDVLWYGTDYTPQPNLHVSMRPLCSGPEFSRDATYLVHAHIRRRDDIMALRGAYNSILIEIEGQIDKMMKEKETWKMRSVDKMKEFKKKLEAEGHSGPEVALFFAVVDVLRNSRNVGAHPLHGMPREELDRKAALRERLAAEFGRLAKKHDRLFGPPTFASPAQADLQTVARWELCIAHMAVAWLDEYSKLP